MPMLSVVVDEGRMSQLERTAGQVGVSVEELLRLSLDEFVARRLRVRSESSDRTTLRTAFGPGCREAARSKVNE